jgi:predicted membrane protein
VIERPAQAGAPGGATTVGLFSEKRLSNRNRMVRGLNAGAVFGSVKVDLTAEPLPEGETKIALFSVFGAAELVVADDVGIHVTGFTGFATVNVRGKDVNSGFGTCDYFSDNYEAATRRLHVEASAVFAELKIKGRA